MSELREKIAKAIRWEFSTAGPHKVEPLVDAILAIPEIRDALRERHEQLGVATKLGRI